MEATQPQVYSFTAIDAGPDYLTATAARGAEGRQFRDACELIEQSERAAGGDVHRATLRDYAGYRGVGFFVGVRREDRICVLSGPRCPASFESIARSARNVSRLDLQVSVWTHGEQPALAREAYQQLTSQSRQRGRPRSLTLIQSHPKGETLNVGKRISDTYGRLYDWTAAHTKKEAATVWRYEVEFKRRLAARQASALLCAADRKTHTSNLVHAWFKVRGIPPSFSIEDTRLSSGLKLEEGERDCLAWFEASISKTIAREINRHGLPRVLLALGLSDKVRPIERRSRANAHDAARTLPPKSHRRDSLTGD
jgi:hypothetical protein